MNMMHMGGPMNGGGGPPPPQMLQMHHPMPHHHHVAVFASSAQAPPPQATPTPPVASSMNRSQSRASCPQSTREMSSHRSTTSRRCGVCRGCQCKPCGQCTYCQDSPQFGGPGVKKQSCIERRCLRVLENRLQRDAPSFKARVGCNACEDCRMQDCQICLVCLDKRFFENRHIPGAMCAKKRCNNAQSIECAPPVMAQSEFIVQRAPKRSYELITPVQQQAPPPQMHFDVKRVQYMTGPPQQQQQQQQIQMQQQMQIQQNPQVQVQQQQRPNSNSSHSQGPSPPRNGIVSQQQTPPQQNGVPQQPNGVHQIKTDVENLEQHHQQQQQQQQQQRMMFQPQPYPDMNGHARMMAPPPPPPVSAPAPMPLPQSQMTHMPQHGLDIPYLIPTFGQNPGSDPFYPSKFELDFEHNGDPFVPPSYAQDMKGQVVLQQL
ncbi:hypothetical protein L5515_005477 [Caenorhabditis briggsae]|uniref:CXXC-type domain-containing protein n=1 Tax=Caenorhabditis briggsae TaxID=6238 RepID=A0AAE9JF06_CAEBR|nr:hypothetical protein L5515_005477 [Caenorhabditis briggsae]